VFHSIPLLCLVASNNDLDENFYNAFPVVVEVTLKVIPSEVIELAKKMPYLFLCQRTDIKFPLELVEWDLFHDVKRAGTSIPAPSVD